MAPVRVGHIEPGSVAFRRFAFLTRGQVRRRSSHPSSTASSPTRDPHPSGIRDALLDNYEEIRVIPAVGGWTPRDTRPPYGLGDVSVLVPREGRTARR